jgi:endonuclease/exonuclease/phosphatase family metal-dependent hydrolase
VFLRNLQTLVLVLAIVLGVVVVVVVVQQQTGPPPDTGITEPGEYLLCFWNVENFFDDQRSPHEPRPDQEYDAWFADNPQILDLKLQRLSEALLKLNGGKGPDILALAEVESVRAAQLLKDRLNKGLADPALHYTHVLMKEVNAGRHIAPAVITRLPVAADRTRLLVKQLRILETHIQVQGKDLVLIASHWTSQLQKKAGLAGRDKYATQIYGRYKAMYLSNPEVDFLVCGDFNTTPDSEPVVNYLHAVAQRDQLPGPPHEPRLLNLFAARDPHQFGTYYYHGRWAIYDQILISPGLLDEQGWSCDPASAKTINMLYRPGDPTHQPWRFGSPHDRGPRGYSDHFPVTVRLKVNP